MSEPKRRRRTLGDDQFEMNLYEIAAEFGVSRQTASKILLEAMDAFEEELHKRLYEKDDFF